MAGGVVTMQKIVSSDPPKNKALRSCEAEKVQGTRSKLRIRESLSRRWVLAGFSFLLVLLVVHCESIFFTPKWMGEAKVAWESEVVESCT